jgi:two-component system KDP operon response regulator KdpE
VVAVREWGVAQEALDTLVSSGDPLSDPGSFGLLVVEDDPAMVNVLAAGLGARGYGVRTATTGDAALRALAEEAPAAIVVDLGLPDVDGIELCRRIRERSAVPIIVVTADGAEDRKVQALDTGADDYVTKPFSMKELLARIRVALRHSAVRQAAGSDDVWTVGDIVVDTGHHSVTVAGRAVDLTPTEFDLLALLARHPGRVLTHQRLLSEVWGPAGEGHVEYLRVYARALRKKLVERPDHPRLVTEPGVGYRLVDLTEPNA